MRMNIKPCQCSYLLFLLCLVLLYDSVKSQILKPCTTNDKKIGCYFKDEACQKDSSDDDSCISCPSGQFVNFEFECAGESHPCDKSENKRWECVEEGKTCKRDSANPAKGKCVQCDQPKILNFDGVCTDKSHPCDKSENKRWACFEEGKTCKRDSTYPETIGNCEECDSPAILNFDGVCAVKKHPCDEGEVERLKCNLNGQECVRSEKNIAESKCKKCEHEFLSFDGKCTHKNHPCDLDLTKLRCHLNGKQCRRNKNALDEHECIACENPRPVLNFDGICSEKRHPCDEGQEVKWKCNEKKQQCTRDLSNPMKAKCEPCPSDKKYLNFDGVCSKIKHPCDEGGKGRLLCNHNGTACIRDKQKPTTYKCENCPGDRKYLTFDGKCSKEKHPCDEREHGKIDCDKLGRKCIRDETNWQNHKCGSCQDGYKYINFDGKCAEEPHPCDEGQTGRYRCHAEGEQCLRNQDDPKKDACLQCPPEAKFLNFDGQCGATKHPCDEGEQQRYVCNNEGEECQRQTSNKDGSQCVSCEEGKFVNFEGKCTNEKHPCDKGEVGQRYCNAMGDKCRRNAEKPHTYECVKCPEARPHLNFDGVCSEEKHDCDQGQEGRIRCNTERQLCTREERNIKKFVCVDCPINQFLNFDGTCSDGKQSCDEGQTGKIQCDKAGKRCKINEHNPKGYACFPCPTDKPIINFDGICSSQKHQCDKGQDGRKKCNKEGLECWRDPADSNKYICAKCGGGRPKLNKEGICDSADQANGGSTFLHHKCRGELNQLMIALIVYITRRIFL